MNRQGLLAVCLVALVALAGCAGGLGGGTTTDEASTTTSTASNGGTTSGGGTTSDGSDSGTVATYLSDRPAAIGDFAQLNATVTRVGLHRVSAAANASGGANATAGEGGTENESDDETTASGWQTVEVNETVDLTELRGENATHIVNQSVPNGTYDNVFVYVSDVHGTLTDGSNADVKLPSGKLHLATTFTVETNGTVDFVYDLAVHETGNGRYIVRPNAGASGADRPLRVVGDNGASANASAGVDLTVAQNDSTNASGSVDLTVTENTSAESGNETNETTTTAGAGANATVEATATATAEGA